MSTESGDGTSTLSLLETPGAFVLRPVEGPVVGASLLPSLPDAIEDDATAADSGIAELVAEATRQPAARGGLAPGRRRTLQGGCYLLRYTPLPAATTLVPLHYDGTLRVQRQGTSTIASGDLYLHRTRLVPPFGPNRARRMSEPNPAAGIPIFARSNYRYYVRVTSIAPRAAGTHFELGFELHRFDQATKSWSLEGGYTADMHWTAAPSGFPGDYLKGDVRSSSGSMVGHLTMGWVSQYLRRVVVEIDRVGVSESPLANAAGLDWHAIFEQIGWDVTIDESDSNLAEPSGESWSDAEMHAEMLARRDSADLDSEWRYWLLCVRRLDSTDRGIMFDAYAGDSNNIPREGAGISSHWQIPNADPWGLVKGMRFGTATDPYFRTAVHEIGHAMGLYHNPVDNGFMHTTPDIAANAVLPQQFPQNIQWSHAPDDQKRLRHMPDMWVRPGGIAFGAAYSTAPISPGDMIEEAEGFDLSVRPLLPSVPIGAPVRVDYTLTNTTDEPLPAPESLSMKSGNVKGKVIDPSGSVRTFHPILRCIDGEQLRNMDKGESQSHSVTLLRGAEGPLFPGPGVYRIVVEVGWTVDGVPVATAGETSVMVTAAVDSAHAEAALQALSTPDALPTLAIGGDHLEEGIAAVQTCLGNDVLRPHYAFIEAKRLGRPFYDRPADIDAAAELIDRSTVLSQAEIKRAAELVRAAGGTEDAPQVEELVKVLQEKVREVPADAETEEVVAKL
jgi:hypothetical protein